MDHSWVFDGSGPWISMGLPRAARGFIALAHGSPMGLPWVYSADPWITCHVSHGIPIGLLYETNNVDLAHILLVIFRYPRTTLCWSYSATHY